MDELDLLKKDWQKPNTGFPKLSQSDIYKMIHSKSSSIVKWIFIISLIEFGFWLIISFLLKDTTLFNDSKVPDMDSILIPITIITYLVLFYFFYRFYINYKRISATDDTKSLMSNILRTRRTVRHYVVFNLASLIIGTLAGVGFVLNNDPNAATGIQQAAADGEIFKFYAVIFGLTIIALTVAVALFLLFYWLIYGLLLRKLNRNYKELKKMEV